MPKKETLYVLVPVKVELVKGRPVSIFVPTINEVSEVINDIGFCYVSAQNWKEAMFRLDELVDADEEFIDSRGPDEF